MFMTTFSILKDYFYSFIQLRVTFHSYISIAKRYDPEYFSEVEKERKKEEWEHPKEVRQDLNDLYSLMQQVREYSDKRDYQERALIEDLYEKALDISQKVFGCEVKS